MCFESAFFRKGSVIDLPSLQLLPKHLRTSSNFCCSCLQFSTQPPRIVRTLVFLIFLDRYICLFSFDFYAGKILEVGLFFLYLHLHIRMHTPTKTKTINARICNGILTKKIEKQFFIVILIRSFTHNNNFIRFKSIRFPYPATSFVF